LSAAQVCGPTIPSTVSFCSGLQGLDRGQRERAGVAVDGQLRTPDAQPGLQRLHCRTGGAFGQRGLGRRSGRGLGADRRLRLEIARRALELRDGAG